MIALALSLVLVAAMSAILISSSGARKEIELSAEVIENGRYGIDLLSRELSQAGFYGTLVTPTGASDDPCSVDVSQIRDSLSLHILPMNSGPLGTTANPPCLDRKPDTDAIFIQRASTCFVGQLESGGLVTCEPETASAAYLQVSECATEYVSNPFVVARGGSTAFILQTKACDGTKATRRRLLRRFYFIARNDVLSSIDVTLDGAQAAVPLVDNIEQMQLEYGVDTNEDGTIEMYTSTPNLIQVRHVLGVRVWLLARSGQQSNIASRDASFDMGDFAGTNAFAYSASSRSPKRRLYSTLIPFYTPKARVER